MGRGRAPCCDKTKVRTGPWSPAEDLRLINFIQKHGHSNWRALPKQAGLLRCGKSCRLRWINYLRPDVKRGNFTPEEEQTVIELHNSFGNKWSKIASCLPGRTDNEIKNVWNTHLKKRLKTEKNREGKDSKMDYSATSSCASSSTTTSIDENREKLHDDDDDDDQDQENQLKQKPESTNAKSSQQSKENAFLDSPSSSFSSCNVSNSSNLIHENRPKQAENTIPQFDDGKTDILSSEFDDEFWDLMDSLDPLQSNKTAQNCDKNIPAEEKIDGEVEFGEWLRFLENELGLTNDDGEQQQIMLTTNQNYQELTSFEAETSSGLFDFSPMWPCSPPHYLGI